MDSNFGALVLIVRGLTALYDASDIKTALELITGQKAYAVNRLARRKIEKAQRTRPYASSGRTSLKINRIKAVRELGIVPGLKEAKDWVEAHFAENGAGPILD
ncbi:MAG: RNA-binding protein [Planctomycetota bacterium]|jgi:ribosomal protein L7/L12